MSLFSKQSSLTGYSHYSFLQFFYLRRLVDTGKSAKAITLSNEFAIEQLKEKIEKFINDTPYSYFELTLLSAKDKLDYNKPELTCVVRNFEVTMEGGEQYEPRRFQIMIYPNWTQAEFFNIGANGIRMRIPNMED